jgi:hypothetical protein
MHTLAVGYLKAFAAPAPTRREPCVWRYERSTGTAELLAIKNVGVTKHIYAVTGDDGGRDTVIEDRLLVNVEGDFCTVRDLLQERRELTQPQWLSLAWFLTIQLLRTPRAFQLLRDEMPVHNVHCEADHPQKLMVLITRDLVRWLHRMKWVIAYNESDSPFLTCDNPVSMWKDRGDGFESGVGFRDPQMCISCPLTPTITFLAYHTQESLRAVMTDPPESEPLPARFELSIKAGPLPAARVRVLNLVTVANADQYVYSNYKEDQLERFLEKRFYRMPSMVRRRDRRPIGSPVKQ